jgi:hypothetical protein
MASLCTQFEVDLFGALVINAGAIEGQRCQQTASA